MRRNILGGAACSFSAAEISSGAEAGERPVF